VVREAGEWLSSPALSVNEGVLDRAIGQVAGDRCSGVIDRVLPGERVPLGDRGVPPGNRVPIGDRVPPGDPSTPDGSPAGDRRPDSAFRSPAVMEVVVAEDKPLGEDDGF